MFNKNVFMKGLEKSRKMIVFIIVFTLIIYLILGSLRSAEGLDLSEVNIGVSLNLEGLTSAEGLVLPESIAGCLYLNSLTSAKGLELPNIITEYLDLGSLTSDEGLVLPNIISETSPSKIWTNNKI